VAKPVGEKLTLCLYYDRYGLVW